MCSILSNPTADECLEALNDVERKKIEKRLANFAASADVDHMGALDTFPLRNMPEALRGIRRKRIGRHRAYYLGHHSECSYTLFYVKLFKKDDVDAEHDRGFQDRLARALPAEGGRELEEERRDTPTE